jgi:O-antigen ligase
MWKFNPLSALFFAILLIGVLYAKNWQVGVYGIIKFLEFFFLAYYFSKKIIKIKTVIFPLALSALFEGFLAIAQFLNKGSLGSILYFLGERSFNGQTPGIANASVAGNLILRPYGTFSHPNVLAGFLLIVISLILFRKYKLNLFYGASLVIFSIALLVTLSRTAILLFAIIIFLKTVLLYKEKLYQKKFLFSLLAIMIIILYFVFLSPFSLRFLESPLGDISVTQRESLANAALAMFLKNPLFGVGVNNFLVNLPSFLSQRTTLLIQPVHNIYLLILAETGITGFLLSIAVIILAFKNIYNKKNLLIGLLFFEVLFLGFFDHYFLTLQQGQLLTALIIGLSFSKVKFDIE